MLNFIWATMVITGFVVAVINGRMTELSTAILESGEESVMTVLKLIGPMSLWLGIMKLAEEAGLVNILARLFKPLAKFLFPKIPADHPVLGAIMMNFSANLLGLGNSATPLGIKAMHQLQELNQNSRTASDAMCTFLVINTSSLTLIPTTILALRVSANSNEVTAIIGTTLFATCCSTIAGILVNKVLLKFELNNYG
ncbi:nucleoside recognition domain-containing protein [Halanaerobacter jeridensis]|uniref:Spore maturation protein A n=1 Tax=Halanaerobacter jeridensis TaxID=706427 RepID=A0A938XUV7_9FIRM|nr:nucleoside recognition domain-containing protein [Halanaerobacter jeridensis]MBM7555992.1 spore maturation protein A [Halanaerobacter jeridensis]